MQSCRTEVAPTVALAVGVRAAPAPSTETILDPLRIHHYIASRNVEFEGQGAAVFKATQSCASFVGSNAAALLDVDRNGVVDGLDATYLLDIMVENFYFVGDPSLVQSSDSSCTADVSIALLGRFGGAPRPGTNVYFDLVFRTADDLSGTAIDTPDVLITKDQVGYYNQLVQAARSSDSDNVFSYRLTTDGLPPNLEVGVSAIQVANPTMDVVPR